MQTLEEFLAVNRECAQGWLGEGWVWRGPVSSLQVSEPSTEPAFYTPQRPPPLLTATILYYITIPLYYTI